MNNRHLTLSLAVALAFASSGASAMGLGPLQVRSGLNQPLVAEIPIVSATPSEIEQLNVRLASPEAFARVGMDLSAELSANLQFSIGKSASGQPVIKVTTPERFSEPFLSFLLEANWGQGTVTREYTALIDPPFIAPAVIQPMVTPSVAAAPAPVAPPVAPPVAQRPVASIRTRTRGRADFAGRRAGAGRGRSDSCAASDRGPASRAATPGTAAAATRATQARASPNAPARAGPAGSSSAGSCTGPGRRARPGWPDRPGPGTVGNRQFRSSGSEHLGQPDDGGIAARQSGGLRRGQYQPAQERFGPARPGAGRSQPRCPMPMPSILVSQQASAWRAPRETVPQPAESGAGQNISAAPAAPKPAAPHVAGSSSAPVFVAP